MKHYELTGKTNDSKIKTVSDLSLLKLYEEAPWTEEEFEFFCSMQIGETVKIDHFTITRTR